MPPKPLSPCAKIGCRNLTRDTYCKEHKSEKSYRPPPTEEQREKQLAYQRHYDKNIRTKRDKKYYDFYKSKEWLVTREAVLARDHGLCQRCFTFGLLQTADVVHHKIQLKDDWSRRSDLANLESLCDSCHQHIHGKGLTQKMARVKLVCGPPGSGKTTYVKNNMLKGDLVVDIDLIYIAISFCDFYDRPKNLLPIVINTRDFILNKLKEPGDIETAWVISSSPRAVERAQLARDLNAEQVIVLAVSAEECMRRIKSDARRAHQAADWEPLVAKWWDEYEPRAGELEI